MHLACFLLFCLILSNVVEGNNNCSGTNTLITFDDLPTTTSSAFISNGYFGLNWLNVAYVLVASEISGSGYHTALSSGSYDALNGHGNPMTITSTASAVFNISSFVAAAAWNDNLNLLIDGKRNGTTIYQQNITLQVTNSSIITLDWSLIDTVSFTTSGGTLNPMFTGIGSGTHFAMDNFCADLSFFYTTTTQVYGNSTTSSGTGGGGGGDDDGPDIEVSYNRKDGVGLTIGGLSVSAFGGIIGAAIFALIILGWILWCAISSKCCSQKPNCNGCGGGGC